MTTYNLYVPASHAKHDIRPGSAIVGGSNEDTCAGMITTHYEGGGHSSNVQKFEQKIHHAAGRRKECYPTIAVRAWEKGDVIEVGQVQYDETLRHWVICEITNEDNLRDWIGPDQDIKVGGTDTLIIEQAGYLFAKLPVADQARIMATRKPMIDISREIINTTRSKVL